MRIDVDRRRCTGIGICESLVPERFEVDDDGTLIVHDDLVTPDIRDGIEDAVRSCPASALSLTERNEQ
ncbi:ferredoxin [Amycolatopsis sp. RM579]|uniref:Ferredoxin n=1 Tax=Amycolatopsis pithecellobii TaxID=664692 RepID=A0A6N7Z3D4_9PSEU|nr:ferredoxin [Amycolatopsis pithecellobii]